MKFVPNKFLENFNIKLLITVEFFLIAFKAIYLFFLKKYTICIIHILKQTCGKLRGKC